MSRILKVILTLVLLGTLAGCQSENDEGPAVGSNTPKPATPAGNTAQLSAKESALVIAAATGDTAKVKEMLDQGVSVETRDLDVGLTPLGHAAWAGHIETAKLLIERGADVNAKKKDGTSILRLAAMRNHNDLAEMLKKAGAQ